MERLVAASLLTVLLVSVGLSQQSAPAPVPPRPADPEFLRAADEVLEEVSKLISLPVKAPLKKSLRSRDEIRGFVIREMNEEREQAKWYADQKALETFGLIPRGFDLKKFLADLLTEQIAGLYDPKAKEFYIADWIDLKDQRMVMSHEMVHALQDQSFDIEAWADAAKPNDDAELARHSVLEGAAIVGMLDFMLREQKMRAKDLPDLQPFIRAGMLSELEKNPELKRAPGYIRDTLLFPYLEGTSFAQRVLRERGSWEEFHKVFSSAPSSTQEILHPDLYLGGAPVPRISLAAAVQAVPPPWKKLDETTLGEFGLRCLLKEFLKENRALELSPAWAGDTYAVFEHQKSRQVLLLFRLRLASPQDAARFFGAYSEALELKYDKRASLLRRPNFFSFQTSLGGVFLYCREDECLTAEGATRDLFDRITRAVRWPDAPREREAAKSVEKVALLPPALPADVHALHPAS